MNPTETQSDTISQLKAAKTASRKLAKSTNDERNKALEFIAKELIESKDKILLANKTDIEEGKNNNLSDALLDRLLIDERRLLGMTASIKKIILQPDPISHVLASWKHPQGMTIEKVSVPLGVICVIYEARPNVTTDAVSLAIKSGNAIVLRGSQHATNSNQEIVNVIHRALETLHTTSLQTKWYLEKPDLKAINNLGSFITQRK